MLPRFEHLLVPVDFTEKNRAALDIALEIAVQNKARVTLLHVIEAIGDEPDEEIRQFYDSLGRRADTDLEALTQPFAAANLVVEHKIHLGKRGQEIVQFSIDHKVDLIVLSSHRIEPGEPPENWGTLSYQVSLLCQCPVLLVK